MLKLFWRKFLKSANYGFGDMLGDRLEDKKSLVPKAPFTLSGLWMHYVYLISRGSTRKETLLTFQGGITSQSAHIHI